MNEPEFLKCGFHKINIIEALNVDPENPSRILNSVNFHPNVLITNRTSFETYYSKILEILNKFKKSYGIEAYLFFKVRVWNMDLLISILN